MAELRYFNESGRAQWRSWLETLKTEPAQPFPSELLANPDCTRRAPGGASVEPRVFTSKFELAETLAPVIADIRAARLAAEHWPGLWDWLAAFYFDSICPFNALGKRKQGEIERYVWVPKYTRYYKHRIGGSVLVYESFADASWVFLHGLPDTLSDYEIQLGSRADWLSMLSVGEAMNALYFDPENGTAKRGGMSKTAPGALFHLIRVLQHLERTFDLRMMRGFDLLGLLPRPFDQWKPGAPSQTKAVRKPNTSSYGKAASEARSLVSVKEEPSSYGMVVEPPLTPFKIGNLYARDAIADALGYASMHALARGVVTPAANNWIMLFVTENKKTSDSRIPYVNTLQGRLLSWEGPADHFAEKRMLETGISSDRILVFYRPQLRAPFKFMGEGNIVESEIRTDRPSTFLIELEAI